MAELIQKTSLFSICQLDNNEVENFSHLTFPFYRETHCQSAAGDCFFLGATAHNGMPVGLAVMQRFANVNTLELLSLVVAKPFRGLGVGKGLLSVVPEIALQAGCNVLTCSFAEDIESQGRLEHLLDQNAWKAAEPLYDMHWVDVSTFLAELSPDFFERALGEYSVTSFSEFSLEQSERLQATIENTDEEQWLLGYSWSPSEWPESSRGWYVRTPDGEPAAWVLAENNREDCVAYPALYVRKQFRRSLLGFGLLAYAWQEQLQEGKQYASGNIRCQNAAMLNLMQRRMGKHIVRKKRVLQSTLIVQ